MTSKSTETSHLKRPADIEASVQPRAPELQHPNSEIELWSFLVAGFGHKRPFWTTRQLAQMTSQRRKSFGYAHQLSAEGAVKAANAKCGAGNN